MGEVLERFPLFPLGLVLLPSEIVPLHIFEERYKTMISLCLDEESEFGIVWLSDEGLRGTGCTATITQVLERMEDGRLNILVQGSRPFRLLRRVDDLPYPAGDVEVLDDPQADPPPAEVVSLARERYADLVTRVTDTRPDEEDMAGLDAYGMAATVDFALDSKQELLELRSEAERLERVGQLFGMTVQRLEYAERASDLARSNGKIRS
jgi:Lon protease-like protein